MGLAISRELAYLLGGEIQLRSTPGAGSNFTLYLPVTYAGPTVGDAALSVEVATSGVVRLPAVRIQERQVEVIPDDRDNIQPDDATLLIVEDEPSYCRILVDMARGSGFKVLVAMRGADALDLARKYHPTAVSLDVFLPDMLGWTVLEPVEAGPRHAAHSRSNGNAG